ncbi:uncharacterized protein LY89DRAFT_760853 [Mollisia scopiformis]|uniref:Uncharacterized protein n=1 Tax=Mollisia scopiformis TaxID=149040 RepID=A0A132BC79_MOLSC|nr:uncharacterized protein LY89DRAFT_760853 [Mollisia scopiformis]KUJ10032.1 hypothetical protein LY89DRAFT_760853 [Mollisia scopiformis]
MNGIASDPALEAVESGDAQLAPHSQQPSNTCSSINMISNADQARLEILRLSNFFGLGIQSNQIIVPQPVPTLTKPRTLLTLPGEIRNDILRILLHNQDLGKAASVDQEENDGVTRQYGLSPAVLRQKFFIACFPRRNNHLSPLTRFIRDDIWETPLRSLPAVKKVKHWTVILSTYGFEYPAEIRPFEDCCRAMCDSSIASINVCVVLKGMETTTADDTDYETPKAALSPLMMLRGLGPKILTIRHAELSEVHNVVDLFQTVLDFESVLIDLPSKDMKEIMETVQGQTHVELPFKMYEALLEYCQTFEQHPLFKKGMELDYHETRHQFKRQYRRICEASTNVVEFVNATKESTLFFDANEMTGDQVYPRSGENGARFQALLLAQDYLEAFERECPLDTRVQKFVQKRKLDQLYSELHRGDIIRRLQAAMDFCDHSKLSFILRDLIDSLDDQLIEIRQARKTLFLWDGEVENRGVDIHPRDPVCGEHINWSVTEPVLGPEQGFNPDPEEVDASNGSDPDDGDDGDNDDQSDDEDENENDEVESRSDGREEHEGNSEAESGVSDGGNPEAEQNQQDVLPNLAADNSSSSATSGL